ncbi:flagellar hook-associated protein FlgK [Virgibacillus flavescens]|uniref:flagellar hook-associated protein FlgK n=1 Tax=Virgibacillus flavescens TaxID=1611422 RepID=UPI003D33C514
MSTFHGLEMAKQALFAQQSALYTTGHNISNANTEGYSRQRVNFETTSPFPTASRNRPEIPGQMGTGVEAGSVQRVRDKFLDYQFRTENSKAGYWNSKADSIARMESMMNEPSENGLSKTMDQFWQSLQDLSVNPKNSGARSVVAQRGLAVAETFNYLSSSLSSTRTDLKNQIDVTVKDANSILSQVNELNKQIQQIEPHGYLANDLYDERDRLVDELSGIVNIKVSYTKSGESSPAIADGLATIELVDDKGKGLGLTLVDGKSGEINEVTVDYSGAAEDAVTSISIGDTQVQPEVFTSNGSLKGFIESYGYEDADSSIKGTYTDMIDSLDEMAYEFAKEFNAVHANGQDLSGNQGGAFFEGTASEAGSAASISVNSAIIDNPDLIAASANGDMGNGENANALADVFNKALPELGENTSVKTYYESLIGGLGVNAQEANRMAGNTNILKSQVENQRMSVSSVSLDEEMTNMIKYQHAYNAAARSLTSVDELLDRIINNMGIVGR